jgi:hypothetical protein
MGAGARAPRRCRVYLPQAQPDAILKAAAGLRRRKDDLVLILLGDDHAPDLPKLVFALNREPIRFAGGVFPGILRGRHRHSTGAILVSLPVFAPPLVVPDLNRDTVVLPDLSAVVQRSAVARPTILVLPDGLAPNISAVLAQLFGHFGNTVHYIGGGAGVRSLKSVPCLFTNEGVYQNAALLVFADLESVLGVRHGWERLTGPVVATKTRRNVIVELNWHRALDVYRDIVEKDCGRKLKVQDFYKIASGYPFGIVKEAAEDVVRDPFSANDKGELVCVGDVPENTALNILKGNPKSLIAAAGEAASECRTAKERKARQCLLFDCVSRGLFLGEDFGQELESVERAIQSFAPGMVPEGVLSVGEISSAGEGYVDFLNKTAVVGIFCDA